MTEKMEYPTRYKDKISQYKMVYPNKTKTELRKIARQLGLVGYTTRLRRSELIVVIDVHNRECYDDECPCKYPRPDRQQGPGTITVVHRRRNVNSPPCDVSLIDNEIIVVNCQCNGNSCLCDAGT